MPQPLNAKEASLFRTVIRNYEDKQYKKGLKAAEQILKKNPKHGDTLAMKALILNSQGKTDEAFALGKVALQCDMKSHVCWHVYGLLHRAVKNFGEAIKAYKFALRLEPESHQISRDLALLQVQMRDYQGYVHSRKEMLKARSGSRQNWTALAVAHHLDGDLEAAENVLKSFEETLKNPPSKQDFENSEAILYRNMLIYEQGDVKRALEHLETDGKQNLDRLAMMELRAKYLFELGRKHEAAKAYRALIDRNNEYQVYYNGLVEALNIDSKDHRALKALFDEYAEKYPRCDAARRIPLDFLEGDDFREAAKSYVRRMLDKGIPSAFANLKHLYSDRAKKELLPSLVQQYIDEDTNQVKGEQKTSGDASNGVTAAYFFLAQHYDYHMSRDLSKALEWVEKAIEMEPKSVEYHLMKARIWKHYGNVQKASEMMEYARTLDTRDRYINTKAAKYQIRNNESEAALKTMGMFTRAEASGGPLADLHDMQCMWYMKEDGDSHARQGNIGLALKRYTSVHSIFDVWYEDQFDFHAFVLRKGQIRAYIDMIRWEDRLREHPFYARAALSAIDIYVKLHDKPLANGHADANGSAEDAAERKKAAKKARKAAQRAEQEAAAKKAEQSKPTKDPDGELRKKDDDPDGLKLAATTEPLADAMKFVTSLLQFSPKSISSQVAGFEVYIRRKKHVLALKCLLAAAVLDRDHPKLHEQIIRFKVAIDNDLASLPDQIQSIITSEFTLIPESVSLPKYNEDFLAKHKDSATHTLSVLRVWRLLSPESSSQCEKAAVSTLELPSITMEEAKEALELLKSWRSDQVESFRSKAASKWMEATVFKSASNRDGYKFSH